MSVALVDTIHAVLDVHDLMAPRLQRGAGEGTWILLTDAVRRGIDTRLGLDDTFYHPDGTLVLGTLLAVPVPWHELNCYLLPERATCQ